MKKLILVLALFAMLVAPAFAIEGEQVLLSYTFPIATVGSSTVTSLYIFKAPCSMRVRGMEIVSVTTTDALPTVNATNTVVFELLASGTAVQSYNLTSGVLTASVPKSATIVTATSVIPKGDVISCRCRVVADSKAVVTPFVTIHYTPTE
jgi:hypothetical protein